MKKGIDISHWQKSVDWNKIKEQGFDFVMIRAAAGNANGVLYKDSLFEEHYNGAKAAGLNVGCYFYTSGQFYRSGRGKTECEYFLNAIKGKVFEYPVAVDIEESPTGYKDSTTQNVIDFCEMLQDAGYYAMIYASDVSGFKNRLDLSRLKAYDKWVAKYSKNMPSVVTDWGIWQFGGSTNYINKVKVDGVSSAACDQDYSVKDYPTIIKNARLNGFNKTKLYKIDVQAMTQGDLEQFKALCNKSELSYTVKEVN